jgi:hypothetical protein
MSLSIERRELEAWLQQVLVPVEPSAQFIRRLKANLVVYRGKGIPTTWIFLSAFLTIIFILVAAIGLVVRLLLMWLNILNIAQNRRRESAPISQVS